ncbi:MAG: hypothetical protein LLG45_02430 [Actinomycetia bacterium]|nr:hypothetical protein [Actinomycetes bacterium]
MDAYEIMREWDRAVGNEPRPDEELDKAVPALLTGYEYEDWKARIEAGNVKAIKAGMKAWGLTIGPLEPFEIDDAIETHERTYRPHSSA